MSNDENVGRNYFESRRESLAELMTAVEEGVKKYRCINCGEDVTELDDNEWHHADSEGVATSMFCDPDDAESTDMADPEEYEDDDARDEAQESLDNFALAIDIKRHVVIVLGTGGPHDELDVVVDSEGYVDSVTYRYFDWFGADLFERRLDSGDPMYRYAEQQAELWVQE